MKTKIIHIICFLLIFIFEFNSNLKAQDSCEVAFVEANKAFADGNYQKVISLLEKRLVICGYSRDTKLQILKLLSSSYYELDEIELAEKYTQKFVKMDPEYEIQSIDDKAFINNFEKFEKRPNWIFGIDFIYYKPKINVLKTFTIMDTETYESWYQIKPEFTYNIIIQKNWSKKFASTAEFINGSITYTKFYNYNDTLNFELEEKFYRLKYALINSFMFANSNIDISSEYKKFKFIKNISINYLYGIYFNQIKNPTIKLTKNGDEVDVDFNIEKLRIPFNVGFTTGFLINYKYERFNFRFQYKYSRDQLSHNIKVARYNYASFNLDNYYVDDDLKFTQTEFSLGLAFNLTYKIKHKYKKK